MTFHLSTVCNHRQAFKADRRAFTRSFVKTLNDRWLSDAALRAAPPAVPGRHPKPFTKTLPSRGLSCFSETGHSFQGDQWPRWELLDRIQHLVPSFDGCDDFAWFFGPNEWLWVVVIFVDEEAFDGVLEFGNGAEHAALEAL